MLVEISGKKVKLPDFFIVGAAKSGTTSLARYLSEHPQIYIPKMKEPQFFAFFGTNYVNNKPKPFLYVKDLDSYVSLFDEADENQVIGEASTWYSINRTVDRTIDNICKIYKNNVGSLKFLFIVRNPIERVLSAYNMYVDIGLENLPLEEAVFSGEDRVNKGYRLELNYIENMFISDSIEKYLKTFGRNNVRIFLYEELKEQPYRLLEEIFRFLGVNADFIPSNIGVVYNTSGIPKSPIHKVVYNLFIRYNPLKPVIKRVLHPKLEESIVKNIRRLFYQKREMPVEVKNKLKEIFKEDILKLQDIINKDLSHWLE